MRSLLGGLALVAAASLSTLADEPADELHSCRDASGGIVLQNDPCDLPPAHGKAPAAEPRKAPAKRPKPAARPRPEAAVVPVSLPPPPAARRRGSTYVATPIRPVIDPSVFTSDPRWGSPERTLKTFVGAMKGGDRALARACLASAAAGDLDTMRGTVEAFSGYVLEGEVGPYWSIRALRPRMRPKWIFFTRAADGTWRIAAL